MTTPHKVTAEFWDHATLWSDDASLAGHSTDGGRVFGITRTRYVECDYYGCSSVAVIDPEDRGQVKRLAAAILPLDSRPFADHVADALRELANPTPPKPTCDAVLWIGGQRVECERDRTDHSSDHRNDSIGQGIRWSA